MHGSLSYQPLDANRVDGFVDGAEADQVVWPEAWPATDVIATVMGDGLREHLLVHDSSGPRTFVWRVRLDGARDALEVVEGAVYVRRANGRRALLSRAAWASDAAGNAHEAAWSVRRVDGDEWRLQLAWGTQLDRFGRWHPIAWPVVIDPDVVVPMAGGDISCDSAGPAGMSATSNASSFWMEFGGGGYSYDVSDYAECVIPGPSASQGTWVSLAGDASWNTSGGNQSLSLFDDDGTAYEDATRYFDGFIPGPGDLVGSIAWSEGAYIGAAPAGDVTATLGAEGPFTLAMSASPRHFEIHNLVRVFRTPVLGSSPAMATTDVGAGFEVTHASGNLTTTQVSSSQKGFAQVDLQVARSYNSLDTSAGMLGRGWIASTERRIEIDPVNQDAVYVATDGRRWVFENTAPLTWARAVGQEADLRLNTEPLTMAAEPYELVWLDGRRERFESSGRLVREVWPMGHYVAYSALTPATGGWTFTIGDGHSHAITGFVSSITNRLAWTKDGLDRTWTYGYDGSGRLTSVTDPESGVWSYAYNGASRLTSATDPISRQTQFVYDAVGSITSVTDPGSAAHAFDYDMVNLEVEHTFGDRVTTTGVDPITGEADFVEDTEGNDLTNYYDDRGRPELVVDNNGDELEYEYHPVSGCMTKEIDADGNQTTYASFVAGCNAQSVTDGENNTTTYAYDGYGNRTSMTTPDSQTTTWSYSSSPQSDSMDPPAGATIEYDRDSTSQVTSEYWIDGSSAVHYVQRNAYDDAGQRTSSRDGDLAASTFAYDDAGRPVRSTDPLGAYTETTYDAAGQVTSERDKNGGVTEYGYDVRGFQTSVEDPLGNETTTAFNQHGDPTSVTDARGNATTYTYDKVGNELTETDPLGRVTTYEYDGVGNQLSEDDPAHFTTSYAYTAGGDEAQVTYPGPYTTQATYDGLLNALTETDERGKVTTYDYDVMGRETGVTNPDGETDETGYDVAGRVVWNENGEDERTSYTLDPMGRVVESENPDTTTRESEWDDAGRELTRTDELGKVTELAYDALGRVTSELRADGGVWQYTYDGNGNRLTEEDPDSEVTTRTYDAANRLLSVEDPEGGTTAYEYDEMGNLVETTDPNGKIWMYEYDDANQRVKMTDPNAVETTYEYEDRGLLVEETTGTKTTTYEYDARGNMIEVDQGGVVSTYTYDGTGNVLVHTMPDGNTISYTYDDAGRKVQEVRSLGGTTTWTYDDAGRVTQTVDPAGTTTYQLDSMGRVTQITYPGSMTVSFTYDDKGQLASVTDWTGTRTYGRDDVGRVESHTTAQGKQIANTYDTSGRKISSNYQRWNNTWVNRSWTYDSAGRVLTYVSGFGTFTYSYTDAGQIATRTYPSGKTETYAYDDAGRMVSQQLTGEPLISYAYDGTGRITTVSYTSGGITTVKHRYTYTASGQLASWSFKEWFKTIYAYDGNGNLTSISRMALVKPSGTNTPTEDTRIAQCIAASCAYAYANDLQYYATPTPYDMVNPTTWTGTRAAVVRYLYDTPMEIRKHTYAANGQFVTAGRGRLVSAVMSYDAQGNQLADSVGITHTFDYVNRPQASSAGRTFDWTHDGLLVRVKQTSNGATQLSLDYDDQGRILWLRSPDGQHSNEYVWDQTGLVGVDGIYLQQNPHGDTIHTHRSGIYPVGTVYLTPWGETHLQQVGDPFYMSGYQGLFTPLYNGRDGVLTFTSTASATFSNDYIMGRRVYNAMYSRFRQIDPLPAQNGVADTAYSYASNDPINRIDPTGEFSIPGLHVGAYCAHPKRSAWCMLQVPAYNKANSDMHSLYPDSIRGDAGMFEGSEAYHHLQWMGYMLRGDYDMRDAHPLLKPKRSAALRLIRGIANAHEKDGRKGDSDACIKAFKGDEEARCIANSVQDSKKDAKNNKVGLARHRYLGPGDISDDAIRNLSRRLINNGDAWVRSWNGKKPYSVVSTIRRSGRCYLPDPEDSCVY